MEKGQYVENITENNPVRGIFIILSASLKETKNGKPYWTINLSDRTGSIEARLWHPKSLDFASIEAGCYALVNGFANKFNDLLQIKLDNFHILDPADTAALPVADFLPASPCDVEEMLRELKTLCLEEFKHPPWRRLILGIFNNQELMARFKTIPAAKKMHHAYQSGLLEHTLGVFKLCRQIADLYSELDRQTLLAGAFFHDIGKVREFSGGLANDYTDEGLLLGHTAIGLEMLGPLLAHSRLEPALQEHLKHLVASHHGCLEFGAIKLPATAEAFVLHYADNLDAKLAQIRNHAKSPQSGTWSERLPGLDRCVFFAERTPQSATSEKKSARGNQCLLL